MKKLLTTFSILICFYNLSSQSTEKDIDSPQFLSGNLITYDPLYTEANIIGRKLDIYLTVGKTDGIQSVSPSGAFNYTIPIGLPNGTSNMTPGLSLNYNSQSRSGLAGYGWNMTGFSSIARTNKDHLHEEKVENFQFSNNDVLALDGIRLILNSGSQGLASSTYKTETETFVLVTANGQIGNGPEWFQVIHKNGVIMEYGKTLDARCYANDDGTILEWKLNKVVDQNGNYILYQYTDKGGEIVPHEIRYTGNSAAQISPYYKVNFEYESRRDAEFYQITKENLLKVIRISYGENNTLIKKYELNYGLNFYSYLNDIKEFGSDFNHFNLLKFNYWEAGNKFTETNFFDNSIPHSNRESLKGDFNGDGISDLLTVNRDYFLNTINLEAHIGTSNGRYFNNHLPPLSNPNALIPFNHWHNFTYDNIDIPRDINNGTYLSKIDVGDYDGDGRDDIAVIITKKFLRSGIPNLTLESITIYKSTSYSTNINFSAQSLIVPKNAHHNNVFENPDKKNYLGKRNPYFFGDFDGDGAKDIFLNTHNGFKTDYEHDDNVYYPVIYRPRVSNQPETVSYGNNLASSNLSHRDDAYLLDMNGNGNDEIMQVFEHEDAENLVQVVEFENTGSGFTANRIYSKIDPEAEFSAYASKHKYIQFGDFNGDGKADMLTSLKLPNGTTQLWKFSYSTGDNFSFYKVMFLPTDNTRKFIIGDINADGKSDIVQAAQHPYNQTYTEIKIHYSTGREFETNNYLATGQLGPNSKFSLIDSDGRGFKNLIFSDNNSNYVFTLINFNHPNKFGQLRYISTGFNEIMKITYASISEPSNNFYKSADLSTYPNIEFHKPIHVVKSILTPDGSGNNSGLNRVKTNYLYSRARLNLQGRGFLGFETVESYSKSNERKDQNGDSIITINSDEYELNTTFVFPRLLKSHQSLITFPTPGDYFSERNYDNIYSIEHLYQIIPLDNNKRFINQLTKTREGDNIKEIEVNTEYKYNSLNSSKNGNIDEIIKTIGDPQNSQLTTSVKLTYDTYGTLIPAHITKKTTTSTRTFNAIAEAPAESISTFDYDQSTGNILWEKQLDPDNNSILSQKEYLDYHSTGIPRKIKLSVPGHSSPDRITLLKYDDTYRFLLERVRDFNGNQDYKEVWTYDEVTGLLQTYDDEIPNNPIATYSYNTLYQKTSETDELGNTTSFLREFDIKSNQTTSEFVTEAHLFYVNTSTPNLGSSKVFYDHNGQQRKTETTDFNGDITQQVVNYDKEGRVKTTTLPFNSIQQNYSLHKYDFLGRPIEKINYDKLNSTVLSSNQISYSQYNGATPFIYLNGNYSTILERNNVSYSQKTTDATGLSILTSDNSGLPVTNFYDSFGNLKETKVNSNTVSSSEYNHLGQQTHLNEVNSGTTTYDFNQIGELTSQVDVKNNTTDGIIYDQFGRILQKDVTGQGTYVYEYYNSGNGIGQLQRVVAPNGTEVEYKYNEKGLLKEKSDLIAGILYTKQFEYDEEGRLSIERYPTGTEIGYSYNGDGYLNQVYNIETGQAFFDGQSVDELGNWTAYTLYDGNNTTKSYDKLGRIKTITAAGLYEREYEFDPITSNLNKRIDVLRNLTETFSYDGLDRLKSATLNGNTYLNMTYDFDGNIDNKSDIGDYTYHPSKKNAVVLVDNTQNSIHSTTQDIEYDALHNPSYIKENGNEWHFEYDVNHHRNRAQIITNGIITTRVYAGSSEFHYDQNGDLMYSVDYIAGGDGLCALVVRDNTPTGSGSDPHVYTVYKDFLGSINTLVDEDGSIVAEQEFDPWGRYRDANTWTASNSLPTLPGWLWRGYTGHEHIEEFQLINMNGRIYDPYIGRMLSPDNYVQDATSIQSYNRYTYAKNNPFKYTDPNGEFIVALGAFIVVGAISHFSGNESSKVFKHATTAAIIVGTAGIGSSVSAGVSAAFGAGANAITVGAVSGAAGGFTAGFVGGYVTAALYGSSNPVGAGLKAGAIGAITGGITGGISGGFKNLGNGYNFWGTNPSNNGLLTYEYAIDASTGSIKQISDLGGADTHFYNVGYWSDAGTAFQSYATFTVDGINTLNSFRIWESAIATVSAFSAPALGLSGYFVEPNGPSSSVAGSGKRIPSGSYEIKPHWRTKHGGRYSIQNPNLLGNRGGILMHSGTSSGWSEGCLLPCSSWESNAAGKVFFDKGGSVETLNSIQMQIDKVPSTRLNIFNAIK